MTAELHARSLVDGLGDPGELLTARISPAELSAPS
jgi:hypothetical protein